mgnify:CR=1 FL=1|jgi:hypothetical protein
MGTNSEDYLNIEPSKDELIEMLNNERNTNSLYHSYIKDITNILVEESELYERIRKIQNRIMMLQYDIGNLD